MICVWTLSSGKYSLSDRNNHYSAPARFNIMTIPGAKYAAKYTASTGWIFGWILSAVLGLPLTPLPAAGAATNQLVINSIEVDNRVVSAPHTGRLNLGVTPKSVSFRFGAETPDGPAPLRIRGKLEGFESDWHNGGGYMCLAVRFFNQAGDQIEQKEFRVAGDSAGWTGSFKTAPLSHRRETLVVPPEAVGAWVVISSAGPPSTVGVYVIANLVMTQSHDSQPATVLLQPALDRPDGKGLAVTPPGWTRDGTHTSMAKVIQIGQEPAIPALAIEDDDPNAHAEWRNTKEAAAAVHPGERIILEWNEMYSIGVGDLRSILYLNLPPRSYRFQVQGIDLMGQSDGTKAALNVFVPQPFWRSPWFWGIMAVLAMMVFLGLMRYVVWQRMQREVRRLKNQQALENERLRIARDIHDDLGARVTQISMISAASLQDPSLSEKTRTELNQIKQESRDLISALYETVWTVNPDYDDLDALGNYLCQMVNQLCKQGTCRSRLQVADLPKGIQVSSSIRHNIAMVVKEAVHNVIKHAQSPEVIMRLVFESHHLSIVIQDHGRGFQTPEPSSGNGLANMRQRMQDIGGDFSIESRPGTGTTVRLKLLIKPMTDRD
jgi:signal transduction histidine kinase